MGKFKNKLYRFMYGRNGTDTLGSVLAWTYFALVLIYTVIGFFWSNAIFTVFYLITSMTLIFFVFFRMFSRNLVKRRRENEKFCNFFKLRKNKFRDRKTHVYRKCKKCGAVLRLPKAKGKHFVVCPRCKNRFETRG